MGQWYLIHDLEAPFTWYCDPSLQVYIGYQLGSQVVPCNGVSNVSLHYMVVSVIPVSNVVSGRMGSQSVSYLILTCGHWDHSWCVGYERYESESSALASPFIPAVVS